jgi:hypothetical protein
LLCFLYAQHATAPDVNGEPERSGKGQSTVFFLR